MEFTTATELGPGHWELLPLNPEGQRLFLVFDRDTAGEEQARNLALALLSQAAQPRPTTDAEMRRTAEHFVACLRAMWHAGEICLRDRLTGAPYYANTERPDALAVGWLDTVPDRVYLSPEVTHCTLQTAHSEHRMDVAITLRALGRCLEQAELLVGCTPGFQTPTVRVENLWQRVWAFEATTLFPDLTA